ncbi:MAG: CDP-archaeol synthase [bacterium]|nr:CDP-archaeol synthase [bacterium]
MLELLLKTFWFLLPAGIANMSPVLFKWIPFLNYPVDLNRKFKGKPIFGSNKTYRGLLFGTLTAIAAVYFQKVFYQDLSSISLIDYSNVNIYILGVLLGFGALLGDMIKSFFKRQMNIKSGKSWVPFDQLDWIIGSLICVSFYIAISWQVILASILLFGLLHPITNLIGYFLHIKKNKF